MNAISFHHEETKERYRKKETNKVHGELKKQEKKRLLRGGQSKLLKRKRKQTRNKI